MATCKKERNDGISRLIMFVSGASILLCLVGCKSLKEHASFTFIQISDPHIGRTDEQNEVGYLQAIEMINHITPRPDFVVATGDLSDNGESDSRQLQFFNDLSTNLSVAIPLHLVPGNHDVGNEPTSASLMNYYACVRQMDYYSFNHRDTHFVVLNSTIAVASKDSAVRTEKQAQQEWLVRDLEFAKSRKPRHIIVFMHHPLFEHSPSEDDSNEEYKDIAGENTFPLTLRKEMIDLFERCEVDYIFAGHLHENAVSKAAKFQMVTTSSISPSNGPGGRKMKIKNPNDYPGFRIVTIYSDRIDYTNYVLLQNP